MSTDLPQGATPRLRSCIDALPTYIAGRRPPAGQADAVKLSSNENPFPPLPGVLEAAADAAAMLNRYPDLTAGALVDALSRTFAVPVEHLATGTGSVGILQQIVQSTAGPGDEVVFAWRSFEAYPIVTQIAGARAVTVPLTADERHDLPAMAAAVTDRTRLVLLCSPNNPTGPAIRRDELDDLLARIPDDVLVVLDEAYLEFVRDPHVPDGLELYRRHANLCVLRTFSKAHGLAGLRVGYAVAHAPVAEALRKTAVPFGVNIIAQAAAVASLAALRPMRERVDRIVAERQRVLDALRGQGWTVPDSEANFVWLRLGEATSSFAAACEAAGVLVRPYAGDGVRITIGDGAANDRMLGITAELAPASRRARA